MPSTEPEVLDRFLNSHRPQDIALLAFGLFGKQKVEWQKFIHQQSSQWPTKAQVEAWISNLPHATYDGLLKDAEQMITRRSNPIAEMQRVGDEILAQVAVANSFFKQLRLAIATSVLTPLIVGGLLFVAVSYEKLGPYWDKFEQELRNIFVAKAAPMPPMPPK